MQTVKPERTIALSTGASSYYDASSSNNESDFGSFISLCSEDHHFNGITRAITLGRLRREIRNNPYLAGLVNKYPEAVGNSSIRSRTSEREYNETKDLYWFRLLKHVGSAGEALADIEDILLRELLIAGELFFLLLKNGKVQLIPSELCGSSLEGSNNSNGQLAGGEVNGITYAENGRPISYRFGKREKTGQLTFTGAPINARFVIHVFHKDRVFMGRGLPWLIPSLRPAHDLYEITRAKTKQIKDVSSIFGTIERDGASQENPLGNGLTAVDESTGESEVEGLDDAADKTPTGPVRVELKPGTFIGLEPGEKLNNLSTKYEAKDYQELIMLMLHAIATPVGCPVELWFSGLGDVNYSGFKGLGAQWRSRRRYVINFLERRFHSPFYFWRQSKAVKEGDLPENPDADEDLIAWIWQASAVLDDEKQARANKMRLESGECSLADIWEEQGQFAEEVLTARRGLWIKTQIAAGNLKPDGDFESVIVPLEFLLFGEIPGRATPPSAIPPEPEPAAKPR